MDNRDVLERKRMLEQELSRYLTFLTARTDVDRIVLFGSCFP